MTLPHQPFYPVERRHALVSRAWDGVISYVTFLVFVSLLLRYLETLHREGEFVVMFCFITLTGGRKHAPLCLWRAEDRGRAVESALSLYCKNCWEGTQIIRLGGKNPYLLSPLIALQSVILSLFFLFFIFCFPAIITKCSAFCNYPISPIIEIRADKLMRTVENSFS